MTHDLSNIIARMEALRLRPDLVRVVDEDERALTLLKEHVHAGRIAEAREVAELIVASLVAAFQLK